MVSKKISLLVLSLLFLGIIVSTSCGCIETDSSSEQIGTTVFGASVVEHEYLFGLMEPEYDARIWVMGTDVVNVQGIKESELNWYKDQYLKTDTPSTTQASKEVVYTSVDLTSSSMEVIGDVYGLDTNDGSAAVDTIRFTIGLSSGGSPVDFNTVQMFFVTTSDVETLKNTNPVASDTTTAGHWTIAGGASGNDVVLESNDKFTILAMPSTALTANQEFNLEIRPSSGGAFGLKRSVPSKINSVNLLY